MRTIDRSSLFNRQFRKVGKRIGCNELDSLITPVLDRLARDEPLDAKYKDHALSGNLAGYRDCHLRPDLILIYEKYAPNNLDLVALGSHSDLFR